MRYILLVVFLITISCTKNNKNKLLGNWYTSSTSCSDFKSGAQAQKSSNSIEFTEKKMRVIRVEEACEQIIEYNVDYKEGSLFITSNPVLQKKCKQIALNSSNSQLFEYNINKGHVILSSKSVFGGCSILIKKSS